jgi:hypothetical protein
VTGRRESAGAGEEKERVLEGKEDRIMLHIHITYVNIASWNPQNTV